MITSDLWSGKRYAILGLARSGMATAEALLASGASLMVWDNREELRALLAGRAEIADPMQADLTGLDAIVVSPGVPLNSHPIAARAAAAHVPIIGDIELFAQARCGLPPHKVVGITGTNGKSTTTALIHHICAQGDVPSLMGGNIGLPILSQQPLPAGGVYVLELSSYQIDLTFSLDCEVALLLNITPDHLDRYAGFSAYAEAKARLFAMQSPPHYAIFGSDDEMTARFFADCRAEGRLENIVSTADRLILGQSVWPSLQGPHNAQNVAAAVAAVEALGLGEDIWRPALASFRGLPHRMERVDEINGVLFVNDSKATNPASTGPALGAYPRIHWILGGLPKSDSLSECETHFRNVVHAYTIGEAGPHFAQLLAPIMPVDQSEMMLTAVERAFANAQAGDVILLSPACASFDQFKDFEARGDCFKSCVAAMRERAAATPGEAAAEGEEL
jgi:UDP-N-acetylmuramoylalanine--D-glutamate ligase